MFNFLNEPSIPSTTTQQRKTKVIRQLSVVLLSTVISIPITTYTLPHITYASETQSTYTASPEVLKIKSQTAPLSEPTYVVSDFSIMLNGQPVTLSEPILTYDNRTYLPLRALGEEILKATVDWDTNNSIASVKLNESQIETFSSSNKITADANINYPIDGQNPNARAFLRTATDKLYLPVRSAVEHLGGKVYWSDSKQTIFLTTDGTDPRVASGEVETFLDWDGVYKPVPDGYTIAYKGGIPEDADGYDLNGWDRDGRNREGKSASQVSQEKNPKGLTQEEAQAIIDKANATIRNGGVTPDSYK